MPVNLPGLPVLHPVKGVRLGTAAAGIRKQNRRDMVVIEMAPGSHTAAVFTRNRFCAAPVTLAREHLARQRPRAIVINTGYANAGTGSEGLADAQACCDGLANALGCRREEVLPFSTGVIGERLPSARVVAGIPACVASLREEGWEDAAHGIMTTDTVAKGSSRRVVVGGNTVTITGICKGAGMIRPNMATMLAFVATDAGVEPAVLQSCLRRAVEYSFNRITVDGDTSTNDACVLIATGQVAGTRIDRAAGPEYEAFASAVTAVLTELAHAIVRDAEGATKFMTIEVQGGESERDCLEVAYTVAHSPLVKTAFFASDPNWGRILAAIGRADLPNLNIDKVSVYVDDVCVVRNGARAPEYDEAAGQVVLRQAEITVKINLGAGTSAARVWTCDLSHEYVRINAEYRS